MANVDELSRLFDAERAIHPPAEGMERGLSRLLSDVARRAAPLPVATGSLKLGLSLVSKWLIVGFVVGLGGAGMASRIGTADAAAAPTATLHAVALPTSVVAHAAPAASTAAASTRLVVNDSVRVAARPSVTASAVVAPVNATTFDEELRLISAATREQERGRARSAEAWLLEHARRFPDGVFAADRDALLVLVACSTHKQPGLAQAFAANHSKSPMVARLLRACGAPDTRARSEASFSETEK